MENTRKFVILLQLLILIYFSLLLIEGWMFRSIVLTDKEQAVAITELKIRMEMIEHKVIENTKLNKHLLELLHKTKREP